MPKKTKNEPARKGRTQVKNLPKNKKELSSQQAKKIKGGHGAFTLTFKGQTTGG